MAKLMQPKSFLRSSEGAVASYNYTDIEDGLGYVIYYAGTKTISGAYSYILSKEQIDPGFTAYTGGDHPRYKIANVISGTTLKFDSDPFLMPKIIKGDVYIVFSCIGSNANPGHIYTISGSLLLNNTALGSLLVDTNPGTSQLKKTYSTKINVAETNIKYGDVISVKLDFLVDTSNTSKIPHDPLNRDMSTEGGYPAVTASETPTKFMVYLPFKIDI